MNLVLTRPLVFFDIEGTGLDPANDRIISLAMHKLFPENKGRQSVTYLFNPERPIPAESTEIHGITDQDVAECTPFIVHHMDILMFLECSDVAGFGCSQYDVPILFHEFARCGVHWSPESFSVIDVGTIFKLMEPRTLTAAMQFYCGHVFDDAHEAMADAKATLEVFEAQLLKYPDLPTTVAELALFSNYGHKTLDVSGKFYADGEGVVFFNFGPHRGQPALNHPDYLDWMWSKDFPADTNVILSRLLKRVQEAEQDDDDEEDSWMDVHMY